MFSDEGVLHDGLPERERVRRWVDVYALRYAHVVVTHTHTHTHIHICTHAHTHTHLLVLRSFSNSTISLF